MPNRTKVVVLGAGPAGLGVAWQLARRGAFDVTVLERQAQVGGNAGSFRLGEQRVDYGSHRLHPACDPAILADIRSMLGDDLLDRPRHGRIRLRGRWLRFPLRPLDLAVGLPPSFLLGVAGDAVRKLAPSRNGHATFAAQLEAGLGRTICRDFYFPYARKIWGLDPDQLDAEQARRRVAAGSFAKLARKVAAALPGLKPRGGGRYFYPRQGFGQISDAYAAAAQSAGVRLRLGCAVREVQVEGGRARGVVAAGPEGDERIDAAVVLSTIPATRLIAALSPAAPLDVARAARALRTRAMILVYLVLATDRFTEYDAHYFPEREIAITRLSEPKNYGLSGAPGRTVLCAELPCATDDGLWRAKDEELGSLVTAALERGGVPLDCPVVDVSTRRLADAYPIYSRDFGPHLQRINEYLASRDGLVAFGRQGLFVHDNTHHTLAMAYRLADCLADDGTLDRAAWAAAQDDFSRHVVED